MTRRIAIIHDWLVAPGGAERVLAEMLDCYPEAELFSLIDFLPENHRGFLKGRRILTSHLQNLPLARTHYRLYLPLMPLLIRQFDLRNFDVIISSSHAVAKGVRVKTGQLHICMCYTPIRYAWDLQDKYLIEAGLNVGFKGYVVRWLLWNIRNWDRRTAGSVTYFIAISSFIRTRIKNSYHRDAVVIYPPVDVDRFALCEHKADFYVAASRLVPYKKMDLIIEAFSQMPERKLYVFGDGPEANRYRALAGSNVSIMGYQPESVLVKYMQNACAFIFAAEEDFGIVPIEAQACGTPVIAYGKGALKETIFGLGSNRPTGIFFETQSVQSLMKAVDDFETVGRSSIKAIDCRDNALRFSTKRFKKEFVEYVEKCWGAFVQKKSDC